MSAACLAPVRAGEGSSVVLKDMMPLKMTITTAPIMTVRNHVLVDIFGKHVHPPKHTTAIVINAHISQVGP